MVLFNGAAVYLLGHVFLVVFHVVWNLLERNVVNVQTLGHGGSRDLFFIILLELVELVMPQSFDDLISEFKVVEDVDLLLSGEDSLAQTGGDSLELSLTVFTVLMLFGEALFIFVLHQRLHELFDGHLSLGFLEIFPNSFFRSLANEHEKVELGERDLTITVHICDAHELPDFFLEFVEVFFVVLWHLIIVRSQCREKVLI